MVVKSDCSIWFTDPHYGIRTNYEGFKSDQELPCNVYRTDPATLEPAGPGEVIHELRIAEDVETPRPYRNPVARRATTRRGRSRCTGRWGVRSAREDRRSPVTGASRGALFESMGPGSCNTLMPMDFD